MAIGSAIFSGVMSLKGAYDQRKAGKAAQGAAEEGARSIEDETEQNIAQEKRSQAQVLGRAKAGIAASGVKFDARKINAVEFTEGELGTKTVESKFKHLAGPFQGVSGELGSKLTGGMFSQDREVSFETEAGIQTGGATEGDSVFTYLREMKRNFATDIGYRGKQGRSRARVARMGGQVAKLQAYAGAAASIASAAGSFGSAYSGSISGGQNYASGSVTSKPSIFNS